MLLLLDELNFTRIKIKMFFFQLYLYIEHMYNIQKSVLYLSIIYYKNI
jgi:hypothetical protein